MKSFIVIAVLFFTLSSCAKKSINAIVIKDCTGSYIDYDNDHYLVCNEDLLIDYQSNEKINVTFQNIVNCPELDGKIVCELYHPYKSIVKIKSID